MELAGTHSPGIGFNLRVDAFILILSLTDFLLEVGTNLKDGILGFLVICTLELSWFTWFCLE